MRKPGILNHKSLSLKAGSPLVTGTLILTATGLASRLIGFFYRIYLSRLFGEENIGIYQLISPVMALVFSLSQPAFRARSPNLSPERQPSMIIKHPGRYC